MPSIVVILRAVRLNGQYGAGFHAAPIEMDHAGATLTGITANMGARETKLFPKEMH